MSAFGQGTGTAFGGGSFGAGSNLGQPGGTAFGAKRSNSFGGSSALKPAFGTGSFGAPASGSTFGQPQQPQQQSQTTPAFGQNGSGFGQAKPSIPGQTNTQAGQGGTTGFAFGQQQQNAGQQGQTSAGGLFGQSNQQNTSQTNGLFGQKQAAPAGGVFGSNSATSSNSTGAGLFGAKPTGQFGTNTQQQPQQQPGGLFGNSQPQQSGGLFGNSQPQPQQQTSGLFGNSQPQQNASLFGNSQSQPSQTTGSLFGSSQPQQQQNGLFSSAQPSGGLFGRNTSTQPQTSTQFGSSTGGTAMMGSQPAQTLVATIDQASYTLPGAVPSQKLYSSLTAPPTKREGVDLDNARPPLLAIKPATEKPTSKPTAAQPQKSTPTDKLPARGPDTREWIDSYAKFLAERPTTLVIERGPRAGIAALLEGSVQHLLPAPTEVDEMQPVPTAVSEAARAEVASNVEAAEAESKAAERRAVGETDASTVADVSLFHRKPNSVTLVRINKRALAEKYFVRPSLEQLAAMSKSELSAVPNLVVGREGYGQIEFGPPVDLTTISNLGDLLGTLVVFERGTVCVYPDETAKQPPGVELNRPATITLEQAWPLDPVTRIPIKNIADPRMERHTQRLRNATESRGGEFVTFAHGLWVFRVPHFSMWGLPEDEMVLDEDDLIVDEEPDIVGVMPRGDMEARPEEATNDSDRPSENQDDEESRVTSPEVMSFEQLSEDDANVGVAPDWISQLRHAAHGLLAASSRSVTAASASRLDVGRMLYSAPTTQRPLNVLQSTSPWIAPSSTESGVDIFSPPRPQLDHIAILNHVKVGKRTKGELPILHTDISFADLHTLTDGPSLGIWTLCEILHGKDPRDRLAYWLAARVAPRVTAEAATASDAEAWWTLVSGRRLEEAAARSVAAGNPHMAVHITLLGQSEARGAAAEIVQSWRQARVSDSVAPEIRRLYELAAGVQFPAMADWERTLGMLLWYSDVEIKAAVSRVEGNDDDILLALIRAASSHKSAVGALNLLSPVDAFLYLQALPSSASVPTQVHDRVCHDLALTLLEAGDAEAAVVVSLHIRDDTLAGKVTRSVLERSPYALVASEIGQLDDTVSLARALHAHYTGDWWTEVGYLLAAKKAKEAHKVLVEHVAPQCVLRGQPEAMHELLVQVGEFASQIGSEWNRGGIVYDNYLSVIESPSLSTVRRLLRLLADVPTPTPESRAAVAVMTGKLAADYGAAIRAEDLLASHLSSSDSRMQSLEKAVALFD